MADGGYGVGLFDSEGPDNFAKSIGKISSTLTGVQTAFTNFGTAASGALANISSAITALTKSMAGLQQQASQISSTFGGGGSFANVATGAGQQGSGNTGAASDLWTAPDTRGPGGYNQGPMNTGMGQMDEGTAAQGPTTMGQPQPTGTAAQAQAGQSGSMLSRALQTVVPGAIGSVANSMTQGFGANMISTAIQGVTIGDMLGGAYGGPSSWYRIPQGTMVSSAADYAQGNYWAFMQGVGAPGTSNWSSIQQSNNQLAGLLPGSTYTQRMGVLNQQQQPGFLNMGNLMGLNFQPGGQQLTQAQRNQMVYQKLFANFPGGKPTAQQLVNAMEPGSFLQNDLSALGWNQGTPEYQQFIQYAVAQTPGMTSAQKQQALGQNTPYSAQQQATSAAASLQSNTEQGLATAATNLNNAATKLLQLVNPLGSLFGGAVGGVSNLLGGFGTMAVGTMVGGKLLKSIGGRIFGKGKGGGGGGGLGNILGDLFGKGGPKGGSGGTGAGNVLGDVLGEGETMLDSGLILPKGVSMGEEAVAKTGLKSIINRLIGGNLGEDAAKLGMSGGFRDILPNLLSSGKSMAGGLGGLKGLLGKGGGLLKGLLGRGAGAGVGEAAGEAGLVAGDEAIGTALDATGVGAPIGLIMNALPLVLGFHKQIGQLFKGAGHLVGDMFHGGAGGILGSLGGLALGGPLGALGGHFLGEHLGGITKSIGGFFGGLFGHHKKQTTQADDGGQANVAGQPQTDSVSKLLGSKVPTNSVIDFLTQPIKGGSTLSKNSTLSMLAMALTGGTTTALTSATTPAKPSSGSGGTGTAAGGIGNSPGSMTGPTDYLSLFLPKQTSSNNGGVSNSSPSSSTTQPTVSPTGGSPQGTFAQNQALGQKMAAAMGWTGSQWTALNNVEMAEAGWNPSAKNPTSAAYGIAQFIDGPSEYYSYGGDPNTVAGQITGFLNYVKSRYGTPSNAWAFHQQHGYYARGTQQVHQTQLAMLHRGEAVVPAADNYSTTPYNRGGSQGSNQTVQLNFKPGSIVLNVPAGATQTDMDTIAKQFVAAISKPQALASVRST